MRKTVIVHLSDIHFDDSDASNQMLDNLQIDLQKMEKKVGKYDLLALTGDCIDCGKVDLYREFANKLNQIMRGCSLRKNRAIIVPGNHDCKQSNPYLSAIKDKYEGKKDIIKNDTEIYKNERQDIASDVSPIYKEFNEFAQSYSNKPNGIGVKYYGTQNMTVRVILLNSCWSTLVNNKYGELYIGDEQLQQIKLECDRSKKGFHLSIACLHHPLDWFSYEERIKLQQFLYNKLNVDFILHGHIHESSYESQSNIDMFTNTFCTGISYHKTGETDSRKDGMRYSIYDIDYDARTVNIYVRATNKNSEFVDDNRLYSKVNKDGFFTLPLGSVSECVMPFDSVSNSSRNSIFLSKDMVQLILEKEELLFRFYRGMEDVIEENFIKKYEEEWEKFKKGWIKERKIKKLDKIDNHKCQHDFYVEQFELYCMHVLNTLNALFFTNHKHVRFLLRKYNRETNCHETFFAEGIYSSQDELDKVKNFKWKEGMIYRSYQAQAALLQSKNMDYHESGNSTGIWIDYLTIAISGIEAHRGRELIPLLSLNIATDIIENESCLQALALTSVYDKMQEVFKLFNTRVCNLVTLYDE